MTKKINCIMLIDDDEDDNFFHEKEITDHNLASNVIVNNSATKALEYLKKRKKPRPELIFLDINMPGMTGWEFLDEYKIQKEKDESKIVIIMLTTSLNKRDMDKSKSWDFVSDYISKPLTKEKFNLMVEKYFDN